MAVRYETNAGSTWSKHTPRACALVTGSGRYRVGKEPRFVVYRQPPGHYPTGYSAKGHGNVVEASDVLRQILNQKIPHQTHPKKVIAQYEIPSDSNPPPFKPMKHASYLPPSLYGVPIGPIDSVTHSHSITTSFGAAHEEPSLPSSYDIYRSMSLKHGGHSRPHDDSLPSPRSRAPGSVSYELLPPKAGGSSHEIVHEQQLHDLTHHLGNGIEVQKSLAYEIADPSATRLHQKRRSDDPQPQTNSTTNSNKTTNDWDSSRSLANSTKT
ncbi:hypothetical protein ZHAS_00006808 [Anopheles sinensis]|uniref:Uncharacterized protein n=1 Tax=Anopheles sinensis TaxID=74873 RepID=A0A084VN38_ANOSI|nr:hypothetical protein ZHAS_00006808 [Anopheles sinensis]